jgi:DNA ligase-associated metallophosphoesterase
MIEGNANTLASDSVVTGERQSSLSLTVRGEVLEVLPELALHWPRARTLFVADPHFGKAAAFRAAGIPVPRGTTTSGIDRLDALIDRTNVRRVVFLGDYLHAKAGRAPETLRRLAEWRERRNALELLLVRGNHDARAGDPPAELGITCVDAPVVEPPFVFAHVPAPSDDGYVLSGHIHPGAQLVGAGGQYERLPCFWFGDRVAVLPAYGDFTGLASISPLDTDQVFVVADGRVVRVSAR